MTINSLINSLLPGYVTYPGALTPQRQSTKADPESISLADSTSQNNTQNQDLHLYTRKDIRKRPADAAPLSSADASQTEPSPEATAFAPQTDKSQPAPDATRKPTGETLSKAEMSLLRELQKADQSVRAHEMAHLAAAGGYAKGGASFSYQRGPDGQNYAVGGEVQVDTSKEASPSANIAKMQIIRRAALAPADPSPQDQAVAAQATLQIAESSKELLLAQTAPSEQPPTPLATEENTEAVHYGVSQTPYPPLPAEMPPASEARPKKSYAAYLNQTPPANDTTRQNIYQIA